MPELEMKTGYLRHINRGENYVGHPGACAARGVKIWQNSCVRWLRDHLPDSGLAEEALLVPPPNEPPYGRRGITSSGVSRVQRVLKVMYRARQLLPFLDDQEKARTPRPENSRKVFIVHGHDAALKTAVARFLERLNLEPIILHEQPNLGRTVIEKFLAHSDVAYAIVLLTRDDRGGLATEESTKYKPRARQNVVLELGFFMGTLSRKRVVAIYQEGVEIPSDYTGVLFIPHDAGGIWQLQLAKEIKASGINVDLNKI